MPDKSKRRRNNKNKRKNKTNRAETCHNEIDGKELVSQQLEEQISEPEYENRNNATNSESAQQNIIPEIIDNAQEVSQDLNNNTNNDQISDNTIPLNQEFISTKLSLAHDSASNQESLAYVVEVPEQKVKNKSKLTNTVKSKSLDNDDAPKIVEITEDNRYQIEESNVNPIIDYSNVVIYDSESDVEWEKIDEFENTNIPFSKEVAKEIISITTLPLDVAHCEETKTLTPEEEVSLRNYLKTLQLSTTPDNIHSLEIKTKIEQIINQEVKHRLRKKGSADDFFIQRLGLPRVLDVIDEEASGESSSTSRRQSYLSDKKSDIEDLEDDVFENKNTIKDKFSTKSISSLRNKPLGQLVQQECLLVGAKLKEPEVSEARGNWTMKTVEKMAGAEVVYLTDSSSSTSSLHEIEEDTDDGIETDVSIRMVTPTIEVTDTENLLKKTFVSCKDDYSMPGCNNLKQSVKVDSSLSEIKNPKEITHEIVVLSTDDIKTNLYVKDLDDCINNDLNIKHDSIMEKISTDSVNDDNATQNNSKKFDLEIKVIKCELNDAFNNLIKEVTSDSEITTEDSEDIKEKNDNNNYTRQDSSSSVSSQCTAKYNPNYSSLNDVSNIQHDEICQNILLDAGNTQSTTNASSHVQDVINSLAGPIEEKKNKRKNNVKQPFTLKDFCIRKIASLPYGDKVLEELASVSARLQNIRESTVNKTNHETNQIRKENISYYHLDPVSSIENIPLSIQTRDIVPPPIKPRNSSLKKSQDEEHWTGVATNTEPVYVCLSPSQKMLIEKTNTVSSNDDKLDLINMPNKFIDRRVHYETNNESTTKTRSKLVDVPEISPVLKSQTGSRLLALICDPSITTNVNSLKNRSHNSLEQLQKDHVGTENISENKIEITNINRDFSRPLRPVPLPKPRKFSTSIYESDESSDFTENSLRSTRNEKKVFHFSTGNLNKEIENDISSIQNLHRFHTDIRHNVSSYNVPRRPSLPKDLCDQQMEYIRRKEKEVDAEIQRLEEMKNSFYKAAQRKGPRAPLVTEKDIVNEDIKSTNNYFISHKRDIVMSKHGSNSENREKNPTSLLFNNQEEVQREKMYSEFATQIAEREERKQQKVIKITNPSTTLKAISKSLPTLDILDSKVNNRIEKEFISKARERWEKLGIRDPETEDERESDKNMYNESKIIEHKIKVIEDGKERDVQRLPSHLQEFVRFTAKGNAESNNSAVWRPGAPSPPPVPAPSVARSPGAPPPPPPPPVWVPGSAGASPQATRKTFRPVHFEETPPSRRKFGSSEQNGCTSGSESEGRLKTSHSAPLTGLSTLGSPSVSSRLPRAPNPTVTLLQKAREGQIPRGTSYLQSDRDSARLPRDRPSPPRGDPVHALRKEYASETEVDRSGYESGGSRKMADAQKKVEGIGPTTKDGIPITLRSEVKDPSRWYKKMYDTIHKNKYDDDYVTIRYKNRRGHPERVISNKSQYAYFDPRSGYLSEPEGGLSRLGSSTWSEAYDSDVATGPRRRTASVQEDRRSDVTSTYLSSNKYSTLASARASQEMYKNQPGRIEDYVPGRSSVIDKEAKQWWDEVMDIFDGWLDENSPLPPYTTLLARAIQKSQNITSTTSLPQASPKEKKDITSAILSKSNMAKALKESGYESDSTLIFRRREDTEAPLSPAERRAAYKDLQAGGEPPLRGFRSPAPPRQDESEIEYIPISSTLTKIRIHKKTPNLHEVICYPITKIEPDMRAKRTESTFHFEEPSLVIECPPAPPRRISSKNSKTLRLVTSTTPLLSSTTRPLNQSQTNVDYLRSKINNKLTRQNTHIIISKECDKNKIHKYGQFRVTSSSAPPAVDRKNALTDKTKSKNTISTKTQSTSSFASSRKMLLPIEYSNSVHSRYGVPSTSRVIERGAGRRTPISNILDKVTSLDKLWSAEKRNEQIDITKASKSVSRSNHCSQNKSFSIKPDENVKSFSHNITHKSRDMVRTAEKLQKMKISNHHTKSSPCLATRNDQKNNKPGNLQTASKISKSSLNVSSGVKKQNQIKTAVVTNLNKKKTIENVVPRPQVSPCHETCSKKPKDLYKNTRIKNIKSKLPKKSGKSLGLEVSNQFGGSSKDTSNSGSLEKLYRREKIYTKEIKQAVVSDSFFQHLFFGKTCDQIVAYPLYEQNTTVLQKAKMFQSLPNDNNTPKLQNSYLIHRKPVSLSCFKIWDRHRSPNQAHSPRSVSWPGRIHSEIRKFDSLTNHENFGSTSSLATVRSKSEPPINKIYFSQTSRPKSPVVLFYNKEITPEVNTTYSLSSTVQKGIKTPPQISCYKPLCGVMKQSLSPTKLILTETTRPVSPNLMNRLPNLEIRKKVINDNISPSTILFFQTSSDDSPKINIKPVLKNKSSRSNSTSPLPTRSPSCRRIHSVRLQSGKYYDEAPKIITRTRSAGDADNRLLFQDNMQLLKTKSDSNLNVTDPDYDEYIRDMQNSKARSERFRELNRYYTYLERVGELERATSTCDVRHRRKDEEIVDFDRWKKIRAIERAEEELNNLYRKLKIAQDENDVLFYPRDVKDFRWNYDRERGLRIKERSVENLKDHFQQLSQFDSLELEQIPSKDTYKPLWRGTSVAETAFHINKLNEQKNNHTHLKFKPTVTLQSETSLYNLQKKIGLGNRLWSSLSMDQVNALKNQLNAIYSKECGTKLNEKKECDFYTVDVSGLKSATQNPSLHVRCNSLVTTNYTSDQEKPIKLSKSESIAAMPCPITSMKELKNNVNKIQMSLSENEKRKISQTLSKELLNKINKCDNENKQLIKQQIDDSKVKEYDKHNKNVLFTNQHFDVTEKPCTGNENIWHDKQRHVVYPNENVEIQNQSSASETETASSDVSNKTTIYRGPSKEVKKKVEYFESVKNITDSSKTIYQAKENINEKENKLLEDKNVSYRNGKPGLQINQIVQSQSCTNIKEFFGESEKNKFLSLPVKPEFQSRSISPHSMLDIVDRETPDTLRFSSDETIWRSRSPSPDPERYWRAYLNLAQRGDVRRLVRRFDSPTTVGTILHRHRSDPEIARNVLNKNWSFLEKLSPQRDKCKAMLPVARVPLRTTNRFMPHIDIISKLASLRRRITPRSRSAEEALECRPGEVNRIRRRFEAMSLLGHVYTSAPDVTELHDIAPYLAGSWVAHRYPKPSDNNKSIKDPSSPVHGQTSSIKKDEILSTPKEPVKLSSILKIEAIRKEGFDPSLHRPVSRYEPPRAPPRPPPTSWPQRLSPYVTSSRHTVTFQETNSVPEPPRRSLHGSYSDTESPRRYVESDVNIHYRCPVRHDPLPLVPERELARQQAEHMKRLYREQRRTKYLQELQDMQNRRHQDNFTPSQKTVVPLNRYDEADKVTARALYTFNGQTPRELSFRKGEIIYVRRQIDANWYEGEVHGKIGLFPYNYVEIQKSDTVQPPKKPTTVEGRARAKFDFIAQTNLELPLKKGEVVVLSRRIDQNWWEGRNGVKTGIFPDSYVTVLQEPTQGKPEPKPILSTDKPVASPAAHGLLNGTDKRSMGSHSYTPQPNSPALANAPPATQPLPGYVAKPAQATLTPSDRGYGPPTGPGVDLNNAEPLYVDTNAEAVPYRAMYKYRPQNPDELELQEGDTVYVLEKCDDGWYVGSSQRTGRFGTFPGNYVERI